MKEKIARIISGISIVGALIMLIGLAGASDADMISVKSLVEGGLGAMALLAVGTGAGWIGGLI